MKSGDFSGRSLVNALPACQLRRYSWMGLAISFPPASTSLSKIIIITLHTVIVYNRGYNKALINSKGPIKAKLKFPNSG